MNRTFKVAKSLTRGVVVTSEKASSYQGKAVKTVVAAAVASLVAGAAIAAKTPVDDIKLGADGALVKDSTNVTAVVTGTATVTYKDGSNIKTDKWDADKYNHTGTTTVTLDGGKIVVDATVIPTAKISRWVRAPLRATVPLLLQPAPRLPSFS